MSDNRTKGVLFLSDNHVDVPVGQLSKAHVQPVSAAKAAAGLRRRAAQTVHRGSAEGNEEQLAAGNG